MANKIIRKTFYLNDDANLEIRAGGIILYRNNTTINEIELLLIDSKYYEDLGGCTDATDETILHTVSREAEEESNKNIRAKDIIKRLKKSEPIYNPKAKYVIYFIEATVRESYLTTEDFGNKEIHDNITRTINWFPISSLKDKSISDKLNFRLRFRPFYLALENIKPIYTYPNNGC